MSTTHTYETPFDYPKQLKHLSPIGQQRLQYIYGLGGTGSPLESEEPDGPLELAPDDLLDWTPDLERPDPDPPMPLWPVFTDITEATHKILEQGSDWNTYLQGYKVTALRILQVQEPGGSVPGEIQTRLLAQAKRYKRRDLWFEFRSFNPSSDSIPDITARWMAAVQGEEAHCSKSGPVRTVPELSAETSVDSVKKKSIQPSGPLRTIPKDDVVAVFDTYDQNHDAVWTWLFEETTLETYAFPPTTVTKVPDIRALFVVARLVHLCNKSFDAAKASRFEQFGPIFSWLQPKFKEHLPRELWFPTMIARVLDLVYYNDPRRRSRQYIPSPMTEPRPNPDYWSEEACAVTEPMAKHLCRLYWKRRRDIERFVPLKRGTTLDRFIRKAGNLKPVYYVNEAMARFLM
ncbi:hypothetical protein DXG01_005345 [Tephrocybe rancida]|nr:hypothetical protein DXG01_005345 [Tephrocybe rancida]